MITWVVNDSRSRVKGSPTFWDDLIDTFGLVDKTGTKFGKLADRIEHELIDPDEGVPDLIVRNASYFRPLRTNVPTIVFVQDMVADPETLRRARCVVYNSAYTRNLYVHKWPDLDTLTDRVIPIGIDFDFWTPPEEYHKGGPIIWVGRCQDYPKGWDKFLEIVRVMPDKEFVVCVGVRPWPDMRKHQLNNVTVHRRQDREQMRDHYRNASVLLCTSASETQHLAGIEAGACGVPAVTTDVGIYWNRPAAAWGQRMFAGWGESIASVQTADLFPREYWLDHGMSLKKCMDSWREIL